MKRKMYLAGPEVFRPDAAALGAKKKALCERYGFTGLFPFDSEVGAVPAGERADWAIYRSNAALMQEADCAIVNLTPFRGPSADVGSVFELGMMVGLGKRVFGYSNATTDLLSRVRQTGSVLFDDEDRVWRDRHGMRVEDFGNADNLMIDACLAEQEHPLVRVSVADGDRYRDLRGFEECLRLAAKELLTRAAPVSNRREDRA
jgi:nucleoside 2-deoxyribosyltransferase